MLLWNVLSLWWRTDHVCTKFFFERQILHNYVHLPGEETNNTHTRTTDSSRILYLTKKIKKEEEKKASQEARDILPA